MIPVRHIAIDCEDGSLAIMMFVLARDRNGSPDEIDREIVRSGIKAKRWRIIDPKDIPQDRTFRDAWHLAGEKIKCNMAKARAIHRQRMREARRIILSELDVAYMRADEAGDDAAKKSISAKKQKLRDVTKHPDIESAKTVDELKAVWPEELS